MNHYTAQLSALLLERYQNAAARLQLPTAALPRPGQYLQAHDPADGLAAVAVQLFAAGHMPPEPEGNIAELAVAGPLPAGWQPGTQLRLRGPLGRGFSLLPNTRRLALAASERNAARLLPLAAEADAVAVFCDEPLGELPSQFEIQPLAALPAALAWADFLALDLPPGQVDELPRLLGIHERAPKTLRGQALVTPPMPCGGLAQCGVCSFATPRKAQLACNQGPVFNLADLLPAA
ncbi:MAG: hypothetical protein KF701_05405 [Anaerolineales bacterium]|nr:MAG: hypothetical protein KF701_05405 [Anaerolineales bacterium]